MNTGPFWSIELVVVFATAARNELGVFVFFLNFRTGPPGSAVSHDLRQYFKRLYCTPKCLATQESDTDPYKLLACSLKGGSTNYFHTLWRKDEISKTNKTLEKPTKNKKNVGTTKKHQKTLFPDSLEKGGSRHESLNIVFSLWSGLYPARESSTQAKQLALFVRFVLWMAVRWKCFPERSSLRPWPRRRRRFGHKGPRPHVSQTVLHFWGLMFFHIHARRNQMT